MANLASQYFLKLIYYYTMDIEKSSRETKNIVNLREVKFRKIDLVECHIRILDLIDVEK